MKRRRTKALGSARLAPSDDGESPPYGGFGDDGPVPATTRSGDVCGPILPKATMQLCLKSTGKIGRTVGGPEDVCRMMRGLEDAAQENFTVLHLDVRNHITGVDNMAKGSLTGVEVHPREVFKAALLNSSAALILVHNHPSGDPDASPQDVELTKRLRAGAEMFGIRLLDHIIVGREGCQSLATRGFMGEPLVRVGGKNRYKKE